MRRSTVSLARYFAPLMVLLMSLTCLALQQGTACAAPAVPSLVAPQTGRIDVSFNPILQGSAFSGLGFPHQATEWQIDGNSAFSSPEWTRTSAGPETQTVVNVANGTFANHLAGKTQLDINTVYYCQVRYQDSSSAWSDWGFGGFMTATTIWYLAEGSTDGGMETWVLVQNPGDVDAHVNLDFQTDQGLVAGPHNETIPPNSRKSYNVGAFVSSFNVSTKVTATQGTIVCERAMYGNNRAWGHDSIGVTEPSSTWYLAEGCTAGGFETWVLVQNPNATPATVNLALQTDQGLRQPAELQNVSIPANSRISFNLGKYVTTFNVSTKVTSTGGGVICERAMYGNNRQWAHDSIGTVSPSSMWFFAEGCAAGDMETWLLVQNPLSVPQRVLFLVMDTAGEVGYITADVQANSRTSINLRDYEIDAYEVSITVYTLDSADEPAPDGSIICERAMYNSARTWGHDSVGTPYPSASPLWTLPEGSTAGGMETWVLIQNPSDTPTTFGVLFMTDTGIVSPPELQDVSLGAKSRRSINVGSYVDSYNVSTWVVGDRPLACERSMYGPGRAWAHNSIGYAMGMGSPSTASSGTPVPFDAASCSDYLETIPRLYPR
jgi:hypothetical protein